MIAGAVDTQDGEAVCLLEFEERRALPTEIADLERRYGASWAEPTPPSGVLAHLSEELEAYFAGRLREFTVPLISPGPPFHKRVWAELRRIPFGETVSYIELARRLDKEQGSRAVGQANGANRIAIVIPCHRVIAADGTLGGYGGKLWRKQRLLELEGALSPLFVA